MSEISYYEEFADKFSNYLSTYLPEGYSVYYSVNKALDKIIDDLHEISGIVTLPREIYVPKLRVDIVFGIYQKSKETKLILIEAKFLNQLSLKDYSQLVGYLQVAKVIDIGLLLLIQKGHSTNKLSNDLQEIVRLKKLPMDWIIQLQSSNERFHFKTGILSYIPNNGMDWVSTPELNGISSFEELTKAINT